MRDLGRERARAERDHDQARLDQIAKDKSLLEAELRAAFGLGGRPRKMSDDATRARKSVCAAITRTLDRIEGELPGLATHLKQSIRLGFVVKYRPAPAVRWDVEL